MSKRCVTHKDAPAAVLCYQCHRPICQECVVLTGMGSFCGTECSLLYRDWKNRAPSKGPRRGAAAAWLAALIIMVLGFFLAVHFIAGGEKGPFADLDLIGKAVSALKGLFGKGP